MRNILLVLLLSVSLVGCTYTAYGKGSVDEIAVLGSGLGDGIDIRERQALEGLDPWSGGFIDWRRGPVASPSDQGPSYEILFFMKWKGRHSKFDRGDLKLIYHIRYVPGTDGPGFVYLPGKDDKYSVNMGTIIREGDDGKWHQASASLDSLMKRIIRR